MSKTPKKKLVLVVNNKGGVGKSVVSRALSDTYRSSGRKVHIYDADGGVGSLVAAYGTRENGRVVEPQDPAVGVGYYDIRHDDTRATLLNSLSGGADIILHDLAGGSLNELKRIVDQGEGVDYLLESIDAQGYEVTLVHVISNVQGATLSVKEYAEAFGDHAKHVVVVNKAWGSADEDFPFWFGYQKAGGTKVGGNTRAKLLEGGASEIRFPALQAGTFAKVEASNVPYSKAANDEDLTITERAHVSRFVKASTAAFLEAKDKLGL